MIFPEYKASMTLTHNDHKSYYESPENWIEEHADWCDWENTEAKQRAIDTDSIWTIQWYPDTPIGFICVAAPTLEEALHLAIEVSNA